MDSTKKWFDEFIKETKTTPVYKPHCFIIYKTKGVGPYTTRVVDKIYQTIEEFETRGFERVINIPSEFGVNIEIYEFD